MDATTTLTATQVFLTCALLGFLLAWMVIFAVLAFRPHPTDVMQSEESSLLTQSLSVTSAPPSLHVMAIPQTPPLPVTSVIDERDNTGEMEIISIR